jgi:pimeloyl-ACP methyl ester carboxylesterase
MFIDPLPENIELGDYKVEFARLGAGRTLLFLHGCDGVDLIDPFLAPLSGYFDIVAPSMPGFGASDLPKDLEDIEDLTHSLMDMADALDLKDCVLVGSSFGGWAAAELATKRSGHFSHLVLVGALGVRFSPVPHEVEIRDIFTVPTSDLPALFFSDPDKAEKAFGGMDFASLPEGAALRYCRNREALTLFGWAPLLNNPGLRARLHRIDIPTLVLWGEDDRIVSPAYGRRYAEAIPRAIFETVPAAGHYLPMEQPEVFARRVVTFSGARPSKEVN